MRVRNVHPDDANLSGAALRLPGEVFTLTEHAAEADWLRRGWLVEVVEDAPTPSAVEPAASVPSTDAAAALDKPELWRRVKAAGLSRGISYAASSVDDLAAILSAGAPPARE